MNITPKQRRDLALLPERVGGWLCLDYANTVEPRGRYQGQGEEPAGERREFLASYRDLVAWSLDAGLLRAGEADALLRSAAERPRDAQTAHARAIGLREVVYRVFRDIAEGRAPTAEDLGVLTEAHHAAVTRRVLAPVAEGFAWVWRDAELVLDRMVWPVAMSAAELLVEGDLERVKICPGVPGDDMLCNWLFYDTSKNRTRRWCNMADCGAIAKARRQTSRRRQVRTAGK